MICSFLMALGISNKTLAASPSLFVEGSFINTVSGMINTEALSTYPDSYGGIQVHDTYDLTVFVTGNHAALEASVLSMVNSQINVNFVDVTHSFSELVTLEHTIMVTDGPSLAAQGVTIGEIDPDATTNSLVITLLTQPSADSNYVGVARAIIGADYPSAPVVVSDSTMAAPTPTYRYTDVAPFWGGDQVESNAYPGNCTTGFGVYDNAVRAGGILTAGHCWPAGAHVYIYCLTGSGCSGFGNYIGPVGPRWYPPAGGDYDFEVITGSSSADVWTGTSAKQGSAVVSAVVSPAVGTFMSTDGSVTGEVRDLRVSALDACLNVTYPTSPPSTYPVCGLGAATGSSPPCHTGDSGGPAYVHTSSNNSPVSAAGTIVATSGDSCYFQLASVEESLGSLTIDTLP